MSFTSGNKIVTDVIISMMQLSPNLDLEVADPVQILPSYMYYMYTNKEGIEYLKKQSPDALWFVHKEENTLKIQIIKQQKLNQTESVEGK